MAVRRPLTAALLIFSLVLIEVAAANPDPLSEIPFGSEFTFSSPRVLLGNNGIHSWAEADRIALAKYGKWLSEFCQQNGKCLVETRAAGGEGKASEVTVLMEDGFKFTAKTDANVVEFSASPLTVKEWDAKAPLIEKLIFDGMASVGLKPQSLYGSGHVNIDKRAAFGGDVLRYRDFIVDFFNHPGLSDGILEKDPFNARGLALLGDLERKRFEAVIAKVDSGKIKTIEELEKAIRNRVFRGNSFYKGYAIHFHKDRLEIRAVRAQKSVREFADLARVFEARIRYLASERAKGNIVRLRPNVGANTAWQSVSQFFYYVTGTGLGWEATGKKLLPTRYLSFHSPLPEDGAFGKRNPCVYWMKDLRTFTFEKVAGAMGGIGGKT